MESYIGIDTIKQCQAAFQTVHSVPERSAGRLLIAGRKLADEIDRRDNQLAEALALVSDGLAGTTARREQLESVLTRHLEA